MRMGSDMTRVIVYIATSQDGYIADERGSVDWLPQTESASKRLHLVHRQYRHGSLLENSQAPLERLHSMGLEEF